MGLIFKTSSSILGPLQVASETIDKWIGFGDLLSILTILNVNNNLFLDLFSKSIQNYGVNL